MNLIKNFSAHWLAEPVDILDKGNGVIKIKIRLTSGITEEHARMTFEYLVKEGFIEWPEQLPPKDDYGLHFDSPDNK